MMDIDRQEQLVRRGFDASAIAAAFGGLVDALPAIATLLSIIWMLIRIYETETTQRVLGRARARAIAIMAAPVRLRDWLISALVALKRGLWK